jgi:hypothetical protein
LKEKRQVLSSLQTKRKNLEKLIEIANTERELQLSRLQEQIDLHKEGTQARLDAEIAYNEQKQALDIQLEQYENQLSQKRIETSKDVNDKIKASDKELRDAQINMAQSGLSVLFQTLQKHLVRRTRSQPREHLK